METFGWVVLKDTTLHLRQKKKERKKGKQLKKKWKASFISAAIYLFVYLSTNKVLSIFCCRDSSFSSFTAWEIVR